MNSAASCSQLSAQQGDEQQSAQVSCACGDSYPAESYGAGFIDANDGVCENCYSAEAAEALEGKS